MLMRCAQTVGRRILTEAMHGGGIGLDWLGELNLGVRIRFGLLSFSRFA
jgi:hypothetical protein